MKVLAAAGDPGGSRCLLPVLEQLETQGIPFSIVRHGFLDKEGPAHWERIDPGLSGTHSLDKKFLGGVFSVFVFGSSVNDTLALSIGRLARKKGIPIITVLDSWTNYLGRLTAVGHPVLYPDVYTVIDKFAFDQAAAQGIPPSTLHITGQPALSKLIKRVKTFSDAQRERWISGNGFDRTKKTLLFVSEPVESDDGTSNASRRYRGYTEKIVLRQILGALQDHKEGIQVALLPHPREDKHKLLQHWNECRAQVTGRILRDINSLEAACFCDGVMGMASILLYEAWLCGKSVLCFQPKLCRQDLLYLKEKEGCFFITDPGELDAGISDWLMEIEHTDRVVFPRPELTIHENAPERVCDLIIRNMINVQSVRRTL